MSKKENSSKPLSTEKIEEEEIIEGQVELSENALAIRKKPSKYVSEDLKSLDERWSKYLEFREKIRTIIRNGDKNKDAILEDVVEAAIQIGKSPGYLTFLMTPITYIPKYFKRKKLKKVIERILEKIFDASLLGYSADHKDMMMICNTIGGDNCFNLKDHRYIYEAIIQKLEQGPIRDECVKLGFVSYIDEKLIDIRENHRVLREIIYNLGL